MPTLAMLFYIVGAGGRYWLRHRRRDIPHECPNGSDHRSVGRAVQSRLRIPDNWTRTDKGGDAVVEELRRNRRIGATREFRVAGLDDAETAQSLGIEQEEVSKVTWDELN